MQLQRHTYLYFLNILTATPFSCSMLENPLTIIAYTFPFNSYKIKTIKEINVYVDN